MPGSILFKTTDDGQSSSTTRLSIQQNGNLLLDSSSTLLIPDAIQHVGDTNTQIRFPAADTVSVETGGSERLRIDSSGNVGIGTTSPDNTLHLLYSDSQTYNTDVRNAGLQIENNNGTDNTYAQIHLRAGNSDAYLRAIREGSNLTSLAFLTDNGGSTGDAGEAMRIDSSGKVGIGTTSPAVLLNVVTTGSDAALFESTAGDANGVQLTLRATSASPADDDKLAVLDFSGKDDAGNNTTYAQIRSHSRDVSNGSESGDITFHTRNSGTFDERVRIQSGGGISFNGDTAAANALDDYEEGSWTPTIDSGGWTLSSTNKANYTKIGNRVFVTLYIAISGSGSGSTFIIDGLPYTCEGNGYNTGAVDFGLGGKKGAYVRTFSSGTKCSFFYSSESTSTNRYQIVGTDLGAGYVIFSISYQIA